MLWGGNQSNESFEKRNSNYPGLHHHHNDALNNDSQPAYSMIQYDQFSYGTCEKQNTCSIARQSQGSDGAAYTFPKMMQL